MLKKRPLRKVFSKAIVFLFSLIVLLFGISSCKQQNQYSKISGETMGTYYAITFSHDQEVSPAAIKDEIDSILVAINDEVSTYIPESIISQFNVIKSEFELPPNGGHFINNLLTSYEIFEETDGYFDPTIMPLVNYWGFGYSPKRPVTAVDSIRIDSLMSDVGLEKLDYRKKGNQFKLGAFNGELDFSAIAKGYAVDYVAQYLLQQECLNYMVEIGGEVSTAGVNEKGTPWIIGINTPHENSDYQDFIEYLSLSNVALASSGNYRNYHEVNGVKYGHTINPKSGYPEINNLLAVSIVASNCNIADAYATACMVMGYDKAQELINKVEDVEACFFIGSKDGSIIKNYSNGFIQYIAK